MPTDKLGLALDHPFRTWLQGQHGGKLAPRTPIRSTAGNTLAECPRKFLYQERWGIQPKGYASALSLGSIFHKWMEALLRGIDPVLAGHSVSAAVATDEKRLTEEAGPSGIFPNGKDLATELQQLKWDATKAEAMALAFWGRWKIDWTRFEVLKNPDGSPAIEKLWKFWPGTKTSCVVQIDLPLVDWSRKEIWLVDHKTTSFDPEVRAKSTPYSFQVALYRVGLESLLDWWGSRGYTAYADCRVVGSVHNIVMKPSIRLKQSETPEQYLDRVREWYREEPGRCLQAWTRFDSERRSREFDARLAVLDAATGCHPRLDKFPRVDSACYRVGLGLCPYHSLCVSDETLWPSLIEQKYVIRYRDSETAEE